MPGLGAGMAGFATSPQLKPGFAVNLHCFCVLMADSDRTNLVEVAGSEPDPHNSRRILMLNPHPARTFAAFHSRMALFGAMIPRIASKVLDIVVFG